MLAIVGQLLVKGRFLIWIIAILIIKIGYYFFIYLGTVAYVVRHATKTTYDFRWRMLYARVRVWGSYSNLEIRTNSVVIDSPKTRYCVPFRAVEKRGGREATRDKL